MSSVRDSSSIPRLSALAGILVILTLVAYRPAWHGGFVWDDDDYVTKNSLLTATDGLKRIWFSFDAPSQYFPLVYTTFRIERHLWGLDPTGYHVVNILLHAANAVLLWRLLARLGIPAAYLAALVFALHPVQVESVAWITERKNVLMGLFFLLTLHAWCSFIFSNHRRAGIYYWLGVAGFGVALTAKTTACTLPIALLLILWFKKRPITRARLLQIVPFLALGLGMGLVSMWWERYHAGTRGDLFALGPLDRLLVATRALWFYLGKLVWPSRLTFIYPQWTISPSDPLAYLGLAAGTIVLAIIVLSRRFLGRAPETAAIYFVATLSPVLGFIMLYTFRYTYVADHYQYLACIGPIALFVGGVAWLGKRLGRQAEVVVVSCIVLAPLLGAMTWRQAASYSNIETLWRATIARNPSCWMAYNNLGIVLVENGRVDAGIAEYEKSLYIRPNYAQAHYNLATALLEKGSIDRAIAECREALKLQPREPDAHIALGNALLAKQDIDGAADEYTIALHLRPNGDAHYNLGNALLKRGETDSAVREFEEAVRLQPDLAEAHMQLADVMAQKAKWEEAIGYYEKTIELMPNSIGTYNNLAWILASCPQTSLRNGRRAVALAEQASGLSGRRDPVVLHTLAAAYAEDRRFTDAVATAQEAMQAALSAGNSSLVEDLRGEIEIYRNKQAYPATNR